MPSPRPRALVATFVCAALAAFPSRAVLARQAPVAFVDVQVVPMDAERVLAGQTVVVENDRITAMGPASDVVVPEGATLVEGSGLFLLPGLCDMHVHLNEEDPTERLVLFLAQGVTTVQSMHGGPYQLELRERVASGEVLGPRVFTTGPTTARLRVSTPEQAESVVRAQKQAGYDAVKMYGDGDDTMSRETYARLAATAHDVGIRLVGHALRNHPFSVLLEERQDSVDHMEEMVYTDQPFQEVIGPYVALQFGRLADADAAALMSRPLPDYVAELEPAVRELAGRLREAEMAVTPTLVTFATIAQIASDEYPALLERDELRYVDPLDRLAWEPDRIGFRNGGWAPRLAFMARALAESVRLQACMVAAFQEEGVTLLTGTDAPFQHVVPGFSLHDELARFVAAGLTPYQALRAATANPAGVLGVPGERGVIAVGQRADLLLVKGNPLEDVGNAAHVQGVMAAGRWLPGADLRGRLEALAGSQAELAPLVRRLDRLVNAGEFEEALLAFDESDHRPRPLGVWLEDQVNLAGYRHLRDGQREAAIHLLGLNTEFFPESANAWDSLGEAYLADGLAEMARDFYGRALALDPNLANSRAKLAEIEEMLGESDA